MKTVFAVLVLSVGLQAQAKMPDTVRYKILNTFQKANAVLNEINNTIKPNLCAADNACAAKAVEFEKLRVELRAEAAEAAKAMGLPEGTDFDIDPSKDEVTPKKAVDAPKPVAPEKPVKK